jgi:type II secretory pathway pseudopilin PulG
MPQTRSKRRTRYATSLVEVLIVMVILLIGIFAVIRVFPIGFQYMKNAENRTTGVRLATQALEAVRNDEANLPETVTFSFYDGMGLRQTVAGFSPDYDLLTEIERTSALDGSNSFYRDLNLYRYVQGERVKVPLPTIEPGVTGSIYTVKLGPIYMDPAFSDPTLVLNPAQQVAFDQYVKVTGAPMTGTPVESDNGMVPPARFAGFLRTINNYVIDYGNDNTQGYLLVGLADHDRTFLVSFTREVAVGTTQTFEDVPVNVPANSFGWVQIPGGIDLVPGTETVRQRFKRISSNAALEDWHDDDPYQFRLARPNIVDGATPTFANIGMLVFNPVGATMSEGGQPFAAYVDYAVLDWHIIRDDREVPSTTPGAAGDVPVRLSVQKIKPSGEENLDGTDYVGVFPSNDPTANSDIVVVRMDTGLPLIRGDYALRTTTDAGAGFWVNNEGRDNTYGTGVIYLNLNQVPRGTPIRVLYKGMADWAVSLSKAAANYKPVPLPQNLMEAWDHDADSTTDPMPIGGATNYSTLSQGGIEYLVFNQCEQNKSAVAIFEYTDNSGTTVRTQPTQFTIGSTLNLPNVPATLQNRTAAGVTEWDFAAVDVTRYMPGRNPALPWRIIGTIKGVSIKSRVIWKDQSSRKARWRIQDMDSYLTQGQLR